MLRGMSTDAFAVRLRRQGRRAAAIVARDKFASHDHKQPNYPSTEPATYNQTYMTEQSWLSPTLRNMHRRASIIPRLCAGSALLLIVFAIYAPAARLMLVHDDAVNIQLMNPFTVLTIFTADWSIGGAASRPLANALWVLTRALFGWYVPAVIHMWNVWLHVLNTALVLSLASRLGRRLGLRSELFPVFSALAFALFPLSYQAVIWAGSIYHPAMLAGGLFAVHLALSLHRPPTAHRSIARQVGGWIACGACVLAATLCHEAGFMFGLLSLWTLSVIAQARRTALPKGALVLAGVALIYPLLFRIVLQNSRFAGQAAILPAMPRDIAQNLVYFAQGAAAWLVALIRPLVGLPPEAPLIIALCFAVVAIGGLVWLAARRLAALGIFALGWWGLLAAFLAVALSNIYVQNGPRLLYAPSVGIAIFWGAAIASGVSAFRGAHLRGLPLVGLLLLLVWSAAYIRDRIQEMERLTPAMTHIDQDLRESAPDARVLLINAPWWNAPRSPSFFIGAEGMPIFEPNDAPASTWAATVSGIYRETQVVRHEASLTHGARWQYGHPGPTLDDTALQDELLDSTHIYKFDYDPPGLRLRRLGLIQPYPATTRPSVQPIALLNEGEARIAILHFTAQACDRTLLLDIGWWSNAVASQPLGVFVHGFDEQGQRILVADRDLLDGLLPLQALPSDRWLRERRHIVTPDATALRQVRLGVYSRQSLKRWRATRSDGALWPADEVAVSVHLRCPLE